jgi:hypothetical protein
MNTGDIEPYPRRRDIRTGAADPVPPTGMIPVIPLVEKPAGDPMPTRKELRTGTIQTVPASGKAQQKRVAKHEPEPRGRATWLTAGAVAVVVAGLLAWFLLAR